MHDIKAIRENPGAFDHGLRSRGLEPFSGALLSLDDRRRQTLTGLEAALARRNAASKDIGQAMARKDSSAAEALKAEVAGLKQTIASGEIDQKVVEAELEALLAGIPNIPLPDVPVGVDESVNQEIRRHGERPDFSFKPKQHFELGEALGLMDFEAASRMSGARFVVLKGALARLERALGQFMIDLQTDSHGYTEVNPPLLVKNAAMFGTAQLPKFKEDQFATTRNLSEADSIFGAMIADGSAEALSHTETDPKYASIDTEARAAVLKDIFARMMPEWRQRFENEKLEHLRLWLVPTAEVPLTNLVREQILDEQDLPIRVTALTPCFRSEAGASGRDTRGMLRQHQFNKVELVSITAPDESRAEHERMTNCAEEVLKRLGLHFRTMLLCTGDMGFASRKTYDIEVWLPGQDTFREISSCSVCGDFQARRMNARYRPKEVKGLAFVHTLNGSGIAVGRALIAVMENYQNADGTIRVPQLLQPYMGGMTQITKA